ASPIIHVANGFFRLVGNPISVITEAREWQCWEMEWFQRLHGDAFHIFAEGALTVCAEELPGTSLSAHLAAGTLTERMLAAAATELRRAHTTFCPSLNGAWSHGDPHTGNFLYDPAHNRARLIDFEVRHSPELDADSRHADDLLVFLQDLIGRASSDRWLPFSLAWVNAYDRLNIRSLLAGRLVRPRGWSRLWWAVRTTYLTPAELGRRVEQLRAALA
ncbi:MAG: hypothetical protein ABI680_17665, partial [Chthoniobacteraceae bacterium]